MRKQLAAISCLCVLVAHTVAYAQQPPDDETARREASAHFRRGVALFQEGDREAALVEFQRAYDAHPTYVVLYNIGQTALSLRRYVDALGALERYVAEGGSAVPPDRLTEVQSMITTLRSRTAHLSVSVNVAAAEIRVDDELVGRSPLPAPVLVDVGRHTVSVSANGYDVFQREISVAGDDHASVDAQLARAVSRGVSRIEVTQVSGPDHTLQGLGIAGFVVTGLCAGAATILGVFALQERDHLLTLLEHIPADVTAVEAQRNQTFTLGLAADILTGTAIALGITSLVLVLVDAGNRPSRERQTPRETVAVRPTLGGVALAF